MESELAVGEYILWLQCTVGRRVATGWSFIGVPRGTEELYLKNNADAIAPIAEFRDFILGVRTLAPRNAGGGGHMLLERGRLIYILRAAERKQRRDLVGLLHMRWQYLEEVDSTMRRIWERQ